MQDVLTLLETLRRPQLLMRAARIGSEEYRRSVHLSRITGAPVPAKNGAAILQLIEIEETLNDQRLNQDTNYSIPRHIDVLIALVGEARLLKSALRSVA